MDYAKESLKKHLEWRGKIETKVRAAVDSSEALSLAYTPGVAAPCRFRSARTRRGGCHGERGRPVEFSSAITGGLVFQPTDRHDILFVYFDICNSYCLLFALLTVPFSICYSFKRLE